MARRILVFGSSGAGKTSLVNLLTDQSYKVASDAKGVTFQTVEYPIVEKYSTQWQFLDTAGLDEPKSGTVSSGQAAINLVDLLQRSKDGFHMVIMVIPLGRISRLTEQNYELFVKGLIQNKIPVLCVVTKCENEEPMQAWVEKNQPDFDKAGLKFQGMVAVCCAKGGRFESMFAPLREESKEAVWESIKRISSATPSVFIDASTPMNLALKSTWNTFCKFLKADRLMIIHVDLHAGLIKLGSDDKEALEVSQKFFKK